MPGRNPAAHPGRSLAARGQFLRAFGGQALFVAVALLAWGAYVIEDQLANPVQASAAGPLFGAVLIATAITLIYCLLRPARRPHLRTSIYEKPVSTWTPSAFDVRERQAREWPKELASHYRYVDHTRIRL